MGQANRSIGEAYTQTARVLARQPTNGYWCEHVLLHYSKRRSRRPIVARVAIITQDDACAACRRSVRKALQSRVIPRRVAVTAPPRSLMGCVCADDGCCWLLLCCRFW